MVQLARQHELWTIYRGAFSPASRAITQWLRSLAIIYCSDTWSRSVAKEPVPAFRFITMYNVWSTIVPQLWYYFVSYKWIFSKTSSPQTNTKVSNSEEKRSATRVACLEVLCTTDNGRSSNRQSLEYEWTPCARSFGTCTLLWGLLLASIRTRCAARRSERNIDVWRWLGTMAERDESWRSKRNASHRVGPAELRISTSRTGWGAVQSDEY